MLSDIEIARQAKLKPISQVAKSLGIPEDDLIPYGRYMAKTDKKGKKKGKLILVTAINPTAAGEGKTTVSIGLAEAKTCVSRCANPRSDPYSASRAARQAADMRRLLRWKT